MHSYLIVILSNQGGIGLKQSSKTLKMDQKRLGDFKSKVSAVFTQLDFPISLYAATSQDQFRKPRTGMWQTLLHDYKLEEAGSVDLDNSFFVGDAGGRPADPKDSTAKDHACSDRLGHLSTLLSIR